MLAERALLHPRAVEWFAWAIGRGTARAFVADEEMHTRDRGFVRRFSPELRQAVDSDSLLEMNTYGDAPRCVLAHRGFDEVGLPVLCGDTDYALKLRASGLRILWTLEITLHHYLHH